MRNFKAINRNRITARLAKPMIARVDAQALFVLL